MIELAAELSNEIEERKSEVIDREDKLSALFKNTSSIISDYDIETEDMVQKLHDRRDEQVTVAYFILYTVHVCDGFTVHVT